MFLHTFLGIRVYTQYRKANMTLKLYGKWLNKK